MESTAGGESTMAANDRRLWSDAWAAFWADPFVMDLQAAIEDFSTAVEDKYKAWHEAILLVFISPHDFLMAVDRA